MTCTCGCGGGCGELPTRFPITNPSGITDNIRKADADPCSDLTFGN